MCSRATRILSWILIALGLFPSTSTYAGDINWAGLYRFEALQIHNENLNDADHITAYALHHLILKPSFVASDGLTIHSRFDVFNSSRYTNSQVGQFLGHGPRDDVSSITTATTSSENSNVTANHEQSDTIAVNELYLTYTHEFGQLLVGRAPIQFGLGITHNAGDGDFDHWLENRDMIAYKLIFGNIFIMPMYGKMSEGNLDQDDDINDYMIQAGYENPDTGLSMGVFYQMRKTTAQGNDAPSTLGPSSAVNGNVTGSGVAPLGFNGQFYNVFVGKETRQWRVAVEAGFTDGKTGIQYPSQTGSSTYNEVSLSGFGIASELGYKPDDSSFSYDMKMGLATGDNPGTADKYEGFVFNRNYQVAELLFNHPMGQYDIFRTSATRTPLSGSNANNNASDVDTESLSNVFYISPNITKRFSDQFNMNARFTYARLNQSPLADIDVDREVGYELDIGATYKPYSRLTWTTTAAALWPGAGFAGGTNNYQTGFAYGLFTRAAIRF